MKFLINDTISYEEIYSSIVTYIEKNHGKQPAYILVNPRTRYKILISSQDEALGMSYTVVQHTVTPKEGIKSIKEMFGLSLLVCEDVEPGFIIICG